MSFESSRILKIIIINKTYYYLIHIFIQSAKLLLCNKHQYYGTLNLVVFAQYLAWEPFLFAPHNLKI